MRRVNLPRASEISYCIWAGDMYVERAHGKSGGAGRDGTIETGGDGRRRWGGGFRWRRGVVMARNVVGRNVAAVLSTVRTYVSRWRCMPVDAAAGLRETAGGCGIDVSCVARAEHHSGRREAGRCPFHPVHPSRTDAVPLLTSVQRSNPPLRGRHRPTSPPCPSLPIPPPQTCPCAHAPRPPATQTHLVVPCVTHRTRDPPTCLVLRPLTS